MSCYTDYRQLYYPSQPPYATTREDNAGASDFLYFSPAPAADVAFSNFNMESMENNLVYDQGGYPSFIDPYFDEFGYPTADNYGPAPTVQGFPYSIAPQSTIAPPVTEHARHTDFVQHGEPVTDIALDAAYHFNHASYYPQDDPAAAVLVPIPDPVPTPPQYMYPPHIPSTPALSRGSSSPGSSNGGYHCTPPYAPPGPAYPHPGVQWPGVVGYGERRPPTTGYPTGLSMRPDYTNPTYFKAIEPQTSSEGSSFSALNSTNYRSETTSPRDGPFLELDASGSLSSAPSRPTMGLPTAGSSSGRKRRAEEEEEEEREEEAERPKKKKRTQTTQTRPPRPVRAPRPATSNPRLSCPLEDCEDTFSLPGGWTRHMFSTHRYEPNLQQRAKDNNELWVCLCGRCFRHERTRDDHPRVCGAAVPAAGWAGWDARIEEIRRTAGASLREEYQRAGVAEDEKTWVKREWERLGVAGLLFSMHKSDPDRCRPRRLRAEEMRKQKSEARESTSDVKQALRKKKKVKSLCAKKQDVKALCAEFARLRGVGGG